ncbi:MAG: ArnT family glycosyltransferase [Myxococcales bacterium]
MSSQPALAQQRRTGPGRGVLVGLFALSLGILTFDSELGSPDETTRWNLALELARHGPAALWDSAKLSRYPPLQSVLAAPLAAMGLRIDGGAPGVWTQRLGVSVSLLAAALTCLVFFGFARRLLGDERRAALAAVLFGLTSPLLPYSKRFFSEPLTALLVLAAFAGAHARVSGAGRRVWLGALACVVLLPQNNLVVVPAVGLGLGVWLLAERRFDLLKQLVGAEVLAAALLLATTLVRFGGTLSSGYSSERFTFATLDGLHGLLFGWGRSVFLFAPMLLLGALGWNRVRARARGLAWGGLAAFGATLLLVASWWCWWGGICWGPRLMLPVLPLASIFAVGALERWRVPDRALTAAVLAGGLYVQFLGVAFKHDFDIYFWMKPDYSDERRAWFEWDRSVLKRMPLHFEQHPWDVSSVFLHRERSGPSRVELAGGPVRRVRVEHRGDALFSWWSISDVYALSAEGRRAAGTLGATARASIGRAPEAALDGQPHTRWTTERKRLDGMWFELELPEARTDLQALELEHAPNDGDFPNGLTARVDDGSGAWREVPATAATPRLRWSPLIWLFAGLTLASGAAALRPGRAAREA